LNADRAPQLKARVRWLLILIGVQKDEASEINMLVMSLTLALGMVVAALTSGRVHAPVNLNVMAEVHI
jgi:hypothetical protein